MFRTILTVIAGIFISGCASNAPKEELHDIFNMVKKRDFKGARAKLESEGMWQFDTFSSSQTLQKTGENDSANNILEAGITFLEDCDKKLAELRKLSISKVAGTVAEETLPGQFEEQVSEFEKNCLPEGKELSVETIQKFKTYGNVDLESETRGFKVVFDKVTSRIRSEMSAFQSEQEKKREAEKKAKEKYEQSPEFYSKKLCEMQRIVNAANSVISRENEAGNISGFVNKEKLYEAGRAIQINKERIKYFGTEYKAKFNHSWNTSQCK